ncbi:MAG: DUF4278 domain-containing protein [Nostoc sp.]|uniref:DUF4278 domain-containing protein n=1 Tax=Nostoc sp. TaxID=1180 RepID=UPI002FF44ABE
MKLYYRGLTYEYDPNKVGSKKIEQPFRPVPRIGPAYIAVPIQMQYKVTSRGVGARHCRAPTGVPHVNDNCYNLIYRGVNYRVDPNSKSVEALLAPLDYKLSFKGITYLVSSKTKLITQILT